MTIQLPEGTAAHENGITESRMVYELLFDDVLGNQDTCWITVSSSGGIEIEWSGNCPIWATDVQEHEFLELYNTLGGVA